MSTTDFGTTSTTGTGPTGTSTTGTSTTGTSTTGTGTTGTGTTEQAKQAASTAADQAQQVAGTATEEVAKVASEAASQAQDLIGEARSQATQVLGEQATSQRDKAVSTLSGLSSDLRSMADGVDGSGLAATLAREVADRAQTLQQHLDGRDPGALLDDVRQLARQRPGLFLAGALVAGLAAGRLARGAQAANSSGSSSTTSGLTGTTGATAGQPLGTADGAPVPTVPPPSMGDSPLVTRPTGTGPEGLA